MTALDQALAGALAVHRQGDIARARKLYAEILAIDPDHAEALHLSGVAALQGGDAVAAEDFIARAIARDAGNARYHNNLGEALKAQGRLADAVRSYRRARAVAPDFAPAANNEGAALYLMGDAAAAVPCLQQAVALDPGYQQARINLALAFRAAGDSRAALAAFAAAIRADPGNLTVRQGFAATAATAPDQAFDQNAREALADTVQIEGVDISRLVRPALMILRRAGFLGHVAEAGDDEILAGVPEIDTPLSGPVMTHLLERTVIADAGFESVFTRLRRATLMATVQRRTGLIERLPRLGAALACQCLRTDFAWGETPEESAAADDILALLDGGGDGGGDTGSPEHRARLIVALAMYRPIAEYAFSDALALHPEFAALHRTAVLEPRDEARLAREVRTLTPLTPAVEATRTQYEDAPYPRWITVDRRTPVSFAEAIAALVPGTTAPAFAHAPVRALVAGCGTGKHAFDAAMLYRTRDLLAVDLSRASLAYARRMARRLGLGGIRFARADILALGAVAERFQVVESSGVLHHLPDPEAGWRCLAERLEPGGFMKVALYSEAARRDVVAAQALVQPLARDGITPAVLRAARQTLLQLPVDDTRRRIVRWADFYSLTGVRDLLFNAVEHRFTIPAIAAMIQRLGLVFVGFQCDNPAILARLRAEEGGRPDDLDAWQAFEDRHPETFAGMYQFWCRKPA